MKQAPGGGWELEIKFQLLPGEDLEAVREKLVPSWLTFGLTTMIDEPQTARGGSPLDNPVYETIVDDPARRLSRTRRSGPYFLAWTATDARFFRTARRADLRLLAVPDHEHRHPAGRPRQRALRAARPSRTASSSTRGWSAGWRLTLSANARWQILS